MRITVELNPELEARLEAQAKARGLRTPAYIQQLVEQAAQTNTPSRASQQEFKSMLDRLARKSPDVIHLRDETFSREMIYLDHD